MNTEKCIDVCNRLLRGERSAVETYNQAIDKFRGEPAAGPLSQLRDEHHDSVGVLEQNVRSMGGKPDDTAGAWGAVANTVQAAANLFGQNSAVEALESGEKSGKSDYESALEDPDVMPECKDLIRQTLLPRVEEHLQALAGIQRTL